MNDIKLEFLKLHKKSVKIHIINYVLLFFINFILIYHFNIHLESIILWLIFVWVIPYFLGWNVGKNSYQLYYICKIIKQISV